MDHRFLFLVRFLYCLHPSLIKEGTLHHPRRRISFDEFGYGDEPQIFWEDDKDDW